MGRLNGKRKSGKVLEMIRVDEGQIRGHLDTVVKASVEQTLNGLLEAEADDLCGAVRYEKSPDRLDTRAGSYRRRLRTKAGEVTLKVPRLRSLPFETRIIERYKRRESGVEESLVQMYLAGVSVRRKKDITEALWGMRVSPPAVSELNQKVYSQIESWRNRKHLGQLIIAMLGVLGRHLKRFLNTGEGSMRKKHQPDNPSARMAHEAAVNRLASLLAKLVAIRHLNNEARKRRQGGADTEKP